MSYQVIQPPSALKFVEMSKQELAKYTVWFHEIFDERMSELEAFVRTTTGYGSWSATFQPESLGPLGAWFTRVITSRPLTAEESRITLRGVTIPIEGVQLTERSFSIAFDVGRYLARTFERAYPQLTWKQHFGDKRYVDFGQPVLMAFGKVPLNPIRIATVIAYKIALKKESDSCLLDVYEVWSNNIGPVKH